MTGDNATESPPDAPTAAAGTRAARRAEHPSPVARFDRRFPRGRIMLLLIAAVLLVNGLTVGKLQFVSIVDEQAWIDHMVRGSKLELFQPGDVIDQETLREFCTRKAEFRRFEPCGSGRLDPKDYAQPAGRDYASHTPFYFWITGAPARAPGAAVRPPAERQHDHLGPAARVGLGAAGSLLRAPGR